MAEPLRTHKTKADVQEELGNDPRINEVLEELWRLQSDTLPTNEFWNRLRELADEKIRSRNANARASVDGRIADLQSDVQDLVATYTKVDIPFRGEL